MKKIFFLLYIILFVDLVYSQDIAPSQQAQSYLDDKNATVDYATGIFRYKIPLLELGNSNYSLPITLTYTACGVKSDDLPGVTGYNWNLNTGGIVTRTIRGGIADEDNTAGYLKFSRDPNAPFLGEDVRSVNMHQRDGECDLFTAVFNDRSVSFIIRQDENQRIYAAPLERTNVKIECETGVRNTIEGWTVTDDEGNRYIYREKEWSADIKKDDGISFNGLYEASYVSSWHLTRIEPMNGAPVVFHYFEEVKKYGKQDGILMTDYRYSYATKFKYGMPLQEHSFDFSSYSDKFNKEIAQAGRYLNNYAISIQVSNPLTEFVGAGQWVRNPDFEKGMEDLDANFRVMGQLTDFRKVSSASNGLIRVLNNLYSTYATQSSVNAQQAALCFQRAKNYVIECIKEISMVDERIVYNGMRLTVRSPQLKDIVCNDKVIEFSYRKMWEPYSLKSLKICDANNQRLSEVYFDTDRQLNRLKFLDKDSVEYKEIGFEYYKKAGSTYIDSWGFFKSKMNIEGEEYFMNTDECAKVSSLKTIRYPDGGKLHIDYEPNRCLDKYASGPSASEKSVAYGGIRIKSLISEPGHSVNGDTVFYQYPLPGIPVYADVDNVEMLEFRGFTDKLMHTRVKNKGQAFLTTGNQGLYYRYVREIRPGRGMQAYLFHVPLRYGYVEIARFYPFWLTGLPLARAEYDGKGGLIRLVKNAYYTDLALFDHRQNGDLASNKDYFCQGDDAYGYRHSVEQLKSNEFYIDPDYMSEYYLSRGNVTLYSEGYSTYSLSLYSDIYLPNIEPRTGLSVSLPYHLTYGGKTLLKCQKEYRFDSLKLSEASIDDFTREFEGVLFQSTEYGYDNPEGSVYPVRMVRTDSRGDTYTLVTKRVTEMASSADSTIAKLKEANILAFPMKEAHLKNNALLDEQVFLYTVKESEGRNRGALHKKYSYVSPQPVSYTTDSPDPSLFSYGQGNYVLEKEMDYTWDAHFYLPSHQRDKSSEQMIVYGYDTKSPILEVKNVSNYEAAAFDYLPYEEMSFINIGLTRFYVDWYNAFKKFYRYKQLIKDQEYSESFKKYQRTAAYRLITEFIEMIATDHIYDYNKFGIALDTIKNTDHFDLYVRYFSNTTPSLLTREERAVFYEALGEMQVAIYLDLTTNPVFLSTPSIPSAIFSDPPDYILTPSPNCKTYRLYCLCHPRGETIRYTIEHKNGKEYGTFVPASTSGFTLQTFDLDLSEYSEVTSLEVTFSRGQGKFCHMTIVPADAEFEAVSYHSDGKIFARYNQNGVGEINEYDSAGHLVRVRDVKGNILKDYEHHTAILND